MSDLRKNYQCNFTDCNIWRYFSFKGFNIIFKMPGETFGNNQTSLKFWKTLELFYEWENECLTMVGAALRYRTTYMMYEYTMYNNM